VTFAVPPEAYDRFVGRYSYELSDVLARLAGITAGSSVLDVGAGTGIGTQRLVELVGSERVAAVDPSEPFVAALRERLPTVDVRHASVESLPFDDDAFDATLAQLVFNFLPEPEAAVVEMRRVTRPGGAVGACVWDVAGEMTLLRAFWDAAAAVDPGRGRTEDEAARMRFVHEGELGELWRLAGLDEVEDGNVVVSASYEDFDDLWRPFTAGVGPAGSYAVSLDDERREALRVEYRRRLSVPDGPFRLSARAWYAVGKA
jgi:SAM-dependent methyltransferase